MSHESSERALGWVVTVLVACLRTGRTVMRRQAARTSGRWSGLVGIVLAVAGVGQVAAAQSEFRFKATPDDAAAFDQFGRCVVASGRDLLVTTEVRKAYLFDLRTGGQSRTYVPQPAPLDEAFGHAAATHGERVLIAAPEAEIDGSFVGAVYVFDRTSGSQRFKLEPSDPRAGDYFGWSVAIDGTTSLIGSIYDDDLGDATGSVYVFDVNTGAELHKIPGAAAGDQFGTSVSLSGCSALVGAPRADPNGSSSGSAYVYDTTSWGLVRVLQPSDGAATDLFGRAVALDGDTAVIGAPFKNAQEGAAYIFDIRSGQQLHRLTPSGAPPGIRFGSWVAVNGEYAVVGSEHSSGAGAAYLFSVATGDLLATLTPPDGSDGDFFGTAVAISEGRVAVGAPRRDDNGLSSGAVYVYGDAVTHLFAVGINDAGAARPLRGDDSAARVVTAFEGLSSESLQTSFLPQWYDPDDELDGYNNRDEIQANLRALRDGLRPGDTFVFYFAGHGAFDTDEGDEESKCQQDRWFIGSCSPYTSDECLMMGADGTVFWDDEMHAIFAHEGWRDVNKLFILDACFAGGFWGTTEFGDTGDLATLPRTAIIASSPEESFSYTALNGITYLALAIEEALAGLADEPAITFEQLSQAIRDQEGWLLDTYSQNGEFEGIIQDVIDFSDVYGEPAAAEYVVFAEATEDFELGFGEPPECRVDLNDDGEVDTRDFIEFLGAWSGRDPIADWNTDGVIDTRDFIAFLDEWVLGCG